MQARFSSRRAFTLLELLLVLMLIGISAATIVPHLNGTLSRWQLRETAHNLQTTLQMASQWACVQQEAIAFVLDEKRDVFSLRPLEGEQSDTKHLFPIGRQSFGQGIKIIRTEGFRNLEGEKVLVFRSDGTSEAAKIVLIGDRLDTNREIQWQIAVDRYGAVHCRETLADETSK
jgi:prepilin-type N-terminal cleavage/methylation domain-containing protein